MVAAPAANAHLAQPQHARSIHVAYTQQSTRAVEAGLAERGGGSSEQQTRAGAHFVFRLLSQDAMDGGDDSLHFGAVRTAAVGRGQ
jgi:hypothetical protein